MSAASQTAFPVCKLLYSAVMRCLLISIWPAATSLSTFQRFPMRTHSGVSPMSYSTHSIGAWPQALAQHIFPCPILLVLLFAQIAASLRCFPSPCSILGKDFMCLVLYGHQETLLAHMASKLPHLAAVLAHTAACPPLYLSFISVKSGRICIQCQ